MDKMQSDRLNMSKKNDITLLRVNYLRGPNIWTYRQVLEVWLDLGELEDWPSHKLPGFNARLTALLPALVEHHCGVGERGGFVQRLEEGTDHVIIELLNLSGMPTGFGQTRSTSQRGVYRMVFRARDEQVARLALAEGHALLMAAINDEPFDVPAAVARLRNQIDDCYLGPSTAAIVAQGTASRPSGRSRSSNSSNRRARHRVQPSHTSPKVRPRSRRICLSRTGIASSAASTVKRSGCSRSPVIARARACARARPAASSSPRCATVCWTTLRPTRTERTSRQYRWTLPSFRRVV